MGIWKKSLLSTASAALILGSFSFAPAEAGGGHGYYGSRHGGCYRCAPPRGYYYGSSRYRRHHHHGLSGGEAALLTAGIIGGIILIDRALEADRAEPAYGYDPYYAPPPRGDLYYRRDDRYAQAPEPYGRQPDEGYDDELDRDLAGGPEDPGASGYNYGAAYNDCKAETRAAASDGGYMIALPAKPEVIQPIDEGAAVRFTASFLASDRGGQWRRTMVCEADEGGVRFLELT